MQKREAEPWERDPFEYFDQIFENVQRQIDELLWRAGELPFTGQPLEHTYTKVIGADGVPHIIESIGPAGKEEGVVPLENDGNEPLVDIWENDSHVTVLVELPGMNKDDLAIEVVGKKLRLELDTEKKVFSKEIELPCKVRPSSVKASYRSSVLEIVMSKPAPRKKKKRSPGSP